MELAKNEAVRPIKEQLREVFSEAELLQKRFAHDLHQRDMQWEQMFEQGIKTGGNVKDKDLILFLVV